MHDLTPRQLEVLQCIRDSLASRGVPPTLREIGARMGIRSINGVSEHLRALERKGLISRDRMTCRTIRLTRDLRIGVCPTCGQSTATVPGAPDA